MKCETENKIKYGNPHEELCNVEDLIAFTQIGTEMNIDVKILARAGKQYIKTSSGYHSDPYGKPIGETADSCVSIVPNGKVYIEISNEIDKMGEFYEKVCKMLLRQRHALPKPNNYPVVRIMSSNK
jgi:hypothetical protein